MQKDISFSRLENQVYSSFPFSSQQWSSNEMSWYRTASKPLKASMSWSICVERMSFQLQFEQTPSMVRKLNSFTQRCKQANLRSQGKQTDSDVPYKFYLEQRKILLKVHAKKWVLFKSCKVNLETFICSCSETREQLALHELDKSYIIQYCTCEVVNYHNKHRFLVSPENLGLVLSLSKKELVLLVIYRIHSSTPR